MKLFFSLLFLSFFLVYGNAYPQDAAIDSSSTIAPSFSGLGSYATNTSSSTPSASTQSPSICTPTNTANDRKSWCDSFDISTDYEENVPHTGDTREYWLSIDELMANPDGRKERLVMAVNGTIPGPSIFANWGDDVIVHVYNNLTQSKNGTSIHFHGIRQNYTNPNDGVVSLTQCPIAPNHTMTYKWKATQYGSSWYHSHIGLQAWEGVFGGIVINGPASTNYDEDKGVLFLNDWLNQTVDSLYFGERVNGPRFPWGNGLINGTEGKIESNGTVTGKFSNISVTQGKSYRLRVVNAAINSHYTFQIDLHNLTVIAVDFVPIVPYTAPNIQIGMGQRYDVIFTADQGDVADSFWIQAKSMQCSQNLNDNTTAILTYRETNKLPAIRLNSTIPGDICKDELLTNLTPYVGKPLPPPTDASWNKSLTTQKNQTDLTSFNYWYMNHTSMQVQWKDPVLKQIYQGQSLNTTIGPFNASDSNSFLTGSNLITLPDKNDWVYLQIISDPNGPGDHPIHLHGHDFYILAQGNSSQPFNGVINYTNPPRRDTALLPFGGYLTIAFKTDNPGVWLMHCHIGWHVEEGFALHFLELEHEIKGLIDYDDMNVVCDDWNSYAKANNVNETLMFDSGV
ncbi:uncharacterized protein N7483_007200 [Penicillium malachiteum]|uniref:uncharacterized protein n=1 Tax=Penicillium malachiteum TaxID=1324776 RepID=UPI002547989B|nr:uncharacterized protein N7483_007200 [Penicillium malachiteum]KAJ5725843.1 hypothetical protein N7483_007200 [Penicillium malachiteum]